MVGTWNATSNADCKIVATLAKKSYEEIEESVAHLLQFDDCPVWSIGNYRGVASKIDSLFAVHKHVTVENLNEFFRLTEHVLAETDPAIDLPEEQKWAAIVHGKVRAHSVALREGISETLVLLSVHGNYLFHDRPGVNMADRISSLIHKLLAPLTLEKLLSHKKDLPRYAEAAPKAFLDLLEADLQKTQQLCLPC